MALLNLVVLVTMTYVMLSKISKKSEHNVGSLTSNSANLTPQKEKGRNSMFDLLNPPEVSFSAQLLVCYIQDDLIM